MLVGPSTGGIGTHVVELARELRALGEDVLVVTSPVTAERFGLVDAALLWPGEDAGTPGRLRRLRAVLAASDVVHAHGLQAGVVGALLAPRTVPLVTSLHNDLAWAGGARARVVDRLLRYVAGRSVLVSGASSDLVELAREHGARRAELAPVGSPFVPGLLAEAPLGAEERAVEAERLLAGRGVTGTGPLVLTISRIAPQKQLETLVAAAAAVRDATWVLAGDGVARLREDLVAAAAHAGAPLCVIGPVADPKAWVRAAEVFVLTSRWEARALVVQEAMAAGTPVVCPAVGGLVDLVDGVGRLVPPEDALAVAEGVRGLLEDPSAREELSQAGRSRAAGWESGEESACRWRGWYREAGAG
ncbi:glycosyltransferase family 4 protein [Phycicoccus endophyticus]|uniref:Glycosyltransferase family 4 protein n=1 Tax=Phycicoccus endophyticus TaxID=1690220 RepID=A0A7G9R5P2_9MICO|nr:glycosyltransferase family 4 protein [Phycicoccus endophyticus]QNN50917.1 glycosyltransferase family 4 protein [Phycicoccus endophyticus]